MQWNFSKHRFMPQKRDKLQQFVFTGGTRRLVQPVCVLKHKPDILCELQLREMEVEVGIPPQPGVNQNTHTRRSLCTTNFMKNNP
jgi:hypothetical protein